MLRKVPWWMFVVAASFLLLYGFQTILSITTPKIGIYTSYRDAAPVIASIIPNSAAEAAGMLPGDRIVQVDGRWIKGRIDWIAAQANVSSARTTSFDIDRGGRRITVGLIPQRLSWFDIRRDEQFRTIIARSGQLIMLALACVVAFSRPKDTAALIGALLLASFAVTNPSVPTGSAAAWRELPGIIGALLWIAAVAQIFVTPLLFTFCATFPHQLIRRKTVWIAIWIPAVFMAAVFVPFAYLAVYHPTRAIGLLPDSVFVGIGLIGVAYIANGVIAMALSYRRLCDLNEKRRVRVLVCGVVVAFTTTMLYAVPVLSTKIRDSVAAVMVTHLLVYWFFPLAFAYSILHDRLFDIRIIIRHGLQYALARRGLLSLMPAMAGILILDLVVHSDQTVGSILKSRGWFYGGMAFLAGIVYRRRQQWLNDIDRRFFRDRYDANRLLREVIEEVKVGRNLDTISVSVLARIQAALHPEFVALFRREKDAARYRPVASLPPGHAVPELNVDSKLVQLLRVVGKPLQVSSAKEWLSGENALLGGVELLVPMDADSFLALGPKRSEEPYSREDETLLATIAASLGMLPAKSGAPAVETIPQRLANRYRLNECIGRGGMGAVYSAFDESLDRPVAIKLIRQDLASDHAAAERFRLEAKAAAGITHRNVVTVYDFGIEQRQPFIVMELLAGRTLRAELEAGRIAPKRTLEILNAVCDAVEEAHHRQLIHRDLKPENIFLAATASGEVTKVLDFGLAKALAVASLSNAPTASIIAGTPYYMAPEQLMGEAPNVSWDLWSLGVIAHEMLVGQRPSLGDAAVLIEHPRWQRFFRQVLDPDPTRRLRSVRQFREELRRTLTD